MFNKISFLHYSFINNRFFPIFEEQKPKTLLDVLFESSYVGEKYSEQDIRDEINTFAVAVSPIYYVVALVICLPNKIGGKCLFHFREVKLQPLSLALLF